MCVCVWGGGFVCVCVCDVHGLGGRVGFESP